MSKLLAVLVAIKNFVFGRDTTLIDGTIKYPGHMNFANVAGEYFHGCKIKRFWSMRALNEFFLPGNEGFLTLVSDIIPAVFGSMLVVYTRQLSDRDRETVERYGREINAKIAEENRLWENSQLERKEQEAAAILEEKEMAKIGRAYKKRVGEIKSSTIGKERERLLKEVESGNLDVES